MIRIAVTALLALLLGVTPASQAAKPPVLMLLEHTEAGKAVQTKIEIKGGLVQSQDKGKARDRWAIRAGDAISSGTRPGDRAVSFYKLGLGESVQLFVVRARYYQIPNGKWVAQFQLIEEPLAQRGPDGRWQPLSVTQGVPSLIMQTGSVLPNAEGYAASLELGFTTGPLPIDAWQVQ